MLAHMPPSPCEVLRITLASKSVVPQCCWRLAVLLDSTVVSVDSEGATQFWDGQFGTLLQRHVVHEGDTLALAAMPDGSAVFSAGRLLVQYPYMWAHTAHTWGQQVGGCRGTGGESGGGEMRQ